MKLATRILTRLCLASTLGLAACGGGSPTPVADPAAVQRGKVLFASCAACHELRGGVSPDRIGPHLAGVLERTAGSVRGYEYSEALRSSGVIWTKHNLKQLLMDPNFIPGIRMAITPLTNDQIDDLLAYLEDSRG